MGQIRYARVIISFLILGVASSNCLQDAIPQERRSNLTNAATSSSYALGIFVNNWAAGYLTSAVVQIIIQEVLGLHARVSGIGYSTVDAFYALAGCEHPTATGDDRRCDVNLVTSHHINVEGWTESYQPTWDRVQTGYAPVAPINLGNMGYFGKTSMYLSSKVVQTAWEAEGLNLEFYKGYNVSWHNAAKYFSPPASMNVSRLKRCNETRLMESEAMEKYVNLTGDMDGIVQSTGADGKVQGRCWNGYFWYPPSCRSDPSTCLTFLTAGTGWNLEETMQKSTSWNMQVATAVANTWSDFTHLPHQGDLMFYWWVPDPTFLDLNPVDIAFPTFDRAAHGRGDKRTAPSSISIDKYVSKDLSVLAPEVVGMLTEFRIEMQEINDMLRDQIQTKDSDFEVACRWLTANQDTWEKWLPDATQCFAGFGLYHEATDKYVQNRLDRSGLNCKACASGTHSSRLIDETGSTYVCLPCAPGTAQPSGAALSCDPCAAGEHQDEEGQSICKRCGIGMYQDARGEKDCKVCPEGTTTPGLSSSRVEDCGCERGSINVAGNGHGSNVSCSACGEGLVCPFAATLQGLKTGTVTESHYQIPSIAPGYYSIAEHPMDLFKCPSTERCPGGRPGECAPGLQGVPCTQCADGQSWDGVTCVDCQSWIVFLWFCAGLWVLLVLPGLYYINKRTVKHQATLALTVGLFLQIIFSWAQIIALVGQMTVKWPSLFQGMTSGTQVLLLDMDAFHVACVGGSDPSVRYVLTALAFPGAISWLGVIFALTQCFPKHWRWKRWRTVNVIGALMQGSFNVMSSIALQPYMCYNHPNGRGSLLKFPGVLCGDGNHTTMLVAGTILLAIFVCGFLTLCAWAACKIPIWSKEQKESHVGSFIFLINRFRSDRWWFGVPLLMRGPLLSLPVVWAADFPEAQVCIASMVLAGFLFIQVISWPWKVPLLNLLDAWGIMWLIVLLMMTPTYPQDSELKGTKLREQLSGLLIGLIMAAMGVVIIFLMRAILKFALTRTWSSRVFDLRSKAETLTGDQLHEMADELLNVASQDLTSRLSALNPHDVRIIEKSIGLLASQCCHSERISGIHRPSIITFTTQAPGAEQKVALIERSESVDKCESIDKCESLDTPSDNLDDSMSSGVRRRTTPSSDGDTEIPLDAHMVSTEL